MKLTILFFLIACLHATARTSAQRITLDERNVSIDKVFKQISAQAGYVFFYADDLHLKKIKVNVVAKNSTLEEALQLCFLGQPFTYAIVDKTIVVRRQEASGDATGLAANASFRYAYLDIRGSVRDDVGQPLAGATISVKAKSLITITNEKGEFTLSGVNENDSIQVTMVGFESQTLRVGNRSSFDIVLNPSFKMEEVVVIGYGTRQKSDVTGAVSQVSAAEIEKSTAVSPELALQGRTAGVFVSSGGGAPNSRNTVRIRGVSTFGNAEPLYVIDGLPIYEAASGVTTGGTGDLRSPMNIYSMINPNDIESITVLKDASAAAIYGVRASNGVILITTKKGKAGKPKVELASYYGIQNIPKTHSVLNTQQYFDLVREAYNANPDRNSGVDVPFETKYGPRYDMNSPEYMGHGATYDWQKELLNKNAAMQDHSVRLSGGSQSTTYYISAGYTKQESPLKANDLERYTVATNVDARIGKVVSAGLTVRLIQEKALTNTQTDLTGLVPAIPFQPIYDPSDPRGYAAVNSGELVLNPDFDPSLASPGASRIFSSGPTRLWGTQTASNWFALQSINSTNYDLVRALGTAFVQVEPIQGLRLRGSLGGDWYMNLRRAWSNFDNWRFTSASNNPWASSDAQGKGRYQERRGTTHNLNKELTLSYSRTFYDAHSIDFVAAASQQFGRWYVSDLAGNVNYEEYHLRSIPNRPPYTAGFANIQEEDALIGYMGRLSYKFRNKYYFDVTVRRDGSSRLAPGHKWDNFPSFAAAWRISAEKFFPKIPFINDLKIRGGWGRLGNVNSAGRNKFLSNVSFAPDYPLGGGTQVQTQGAALRDFANTSLTWEKVKTINAGFDAMLFNNHVSLTAEYYDRTTFDIIQSVALPPNTGIQNNADLNVATVKNTGVEMQIGYNNKIGPVDFNVSANLTTTKNRVVGLNRGTPFGGNADRVEEGYSMFYLWGYKAGGIFQTQEEIDAWRNSYADATVNQNRSNPASGYQYQPGDMYFVDVYGNPKTPGERYSFIPDSLINANDQTYLGKTIPGYFYGFNFGANYKGIDISVFFQGVGDVQKYNSTRVDLERMSGLANQLSTVLERWTPSNPSKTMPRAVYNNAANVSRFSSRYVEDAGYLRLRNLQVGYSLPRTLLDKTGFIQNIRIYVSGVNLFTITDWSGLDPENDAIPNTRQYLFGINATF